MFDLDFLVINFFVYSVIGYVCEVIYCSIPAKRFVNRGFLYGPWLPIYGTGALIVIIFLEPFRNRWYLVFIFGLVLTSALEYFTSWVLEKIFHMKLWDYSAHRINIHGRVCGLNSTLFGIMGLAGVYVVDPFLAPRILSIPEGLRHFLSSLILVVMSIDATISIIHLASFQKALRDMAEKVRIVSEMAPSEFKEKLELQLEKARERSQATARHFLYSNPTISARSEEMRTELEEFRKYLERRNKIRKDYKDALRQNRADYVQKRK